MTRLARTLVGPVLTAVVLAGSACGDEDPDAIPAADGTAFVDGALEGIPLFRAATAIQQPNEPRTGVTAASYETITAAPDAVIDWYQQRLATDGWDEVVAVHEEGRDIWQGEWQRDGRRLEVSTSPLPSDDATRTQFDLVLYEQG
ncbi:MAG: hypothetical protein R2713_18025 [Ilumatobacteraceae bacterium]|nr:hypothetical protein [Acidimicrobiales bacterium]MCB9396061.1 hypothetical protein [Acidimicrobiaceae bacterium]